MEAQRHSKIVFGEAYKAGSEHGQQSVLDEEREKHQKRAQRFNTEFRDPARRGELRQVARQERSKRDGFKTGLDLFTEEEVARRKARAARFDTADATLAYQPVVPDEDELKKRKRAQRFGVDYQPDDTGLMDVDLLEERRQAAAEVARRPEAVHLYGVDLMTTREVLTYFADYGPSLVEWLNDSSCNVVFGDPYTAKRAIVGLGKPLPPEDAPDFQGLQVDISQMAHLWHKGPDFVKGGTPIPLIFRLATVEDVKPPPGQRFTRRLWQVPIRQAKQLQQQQQGRQAGGDESMLERGERGGKRARNKKRRLRGLGEVDMADAQEMGEEDEELAQAEAEPDVARPAVADARELLTRRRADQHGLFSAAGAGLAPAAGDEQPADGATAALQPEPDAPQALAAGQDGPADAQITGLRAVAPARELVTYDELAGGATR